MHEKFISMVIDENREFCDLSDHNLMTAVFQGSKRCGKTFVRKHSSESTYMKINDETKAAFMDTVRNNINIDTSIGEYVMLRHGIRFSLKKLKFSTEGRQPRVW